MCVGHPQPYSSALTNDQDLRSIILPAPLPMTASETGHPMSVLRSLESKIAGLVEGTFSRAFRSEVRPVEIARKLAREMEEHRVASLSRTYAPNEYVVWLCSRRNCCR